MKFLGTRATDQLNTRWDQQNAIKATIDVYVGSRKGKHNKELYAKVKDKKLLPLIEVLNSEFPDYDFACLTMKDFKVVDVEQVANLCKLSEHLSFGSVWPVLEYCIGPRSKAHLDIDGGLHVPVEFDMDAWSQVDIYLFEPQDEQMDPNDGIWSFHLLFHHKKLDRICYFGASQKPFDEASSGQSTPMLQSQSSAVSVSNVLKRKRNSEIY